MRNRWDKISKKKTIKLCPTSTTVSNISAEHILLYEMNKKEKIEKDKMSITFRSQYVNNVLNWQKVPFFDQFHFHCFYRKDDKNDRFNICSMDSTGQGASSLYYSDHVNDESIGKTWFFVSSLPLLLLFFSFLLPFPCSCSNVSKWLKMETIDSHVPKR